MSWLEVSYLVVLNCQLSVLFVSGSSFRGQSLIVAAQYLNFGMRMNLDFLFARRCRSAQSLHRVASRIQWGVYLDIHEQLCVTIILTVCLLPSAQTDMSVVTLFCTQEHGILLQDCFPLPSGLQALLGVDVPYYCFSCKVRTQKTVLLVCCLLRRRGGGSSWKV